MWEQVQSAIALGLGLGAEQQDLAAWQMAIRAAVLFIAAIAIMRLGDKRFLGKYAPLDVMLAVVYGSIVSRAITGNAPFFASLAACLTLVALHWVLAALAFRFPRFERLVKGEKSLLVKDGEIRWDEMRKSHISREDLEEALRQHLHSPRLADVKSACLERDGGISFSLRDRGRNK